MTSRRFAQGRLSLWQWLLACVLMLAANALWAQGSSRVIEHAKTGYQLTGAHARARCEACHVQGVFRGTPRDCATCHVNGRRLAGSNVVMPVRHVPTQAACDSCHNTVTFAGARFNHMGVTPGTCARCHNGITATGKTVGHVATTASCDACHRTSAWLPAAKPDHSQFTAATNCANCHNGRSATGKPATHMPTTGNCISCHNTVTWRPSTWNHSQQPVTGQCSNCHNGAYPPADGKTANHIPYQMLTGVAIPNCDSCHKSGYTTWFPGGFHANVTVTSQCATCHLTGAYGLTSKPATPTHATVTGNCEACHKTTSSWFVAKPDHTLFTAATNCTTCHNGTSATGKTSTHIPTTSNCFTCHSTTAWLPSKWNHTQQPVAAQCSTCHNGAYPPADGKTANHIPYQSLSGVAIANCDSCHKSGYTTWFPGGFHANVTVTNQCATCHLTGAYGLTSKPATATHATVTGNCESCHKTTSSWFAAKPDHTLFTAATNCTTCHNGTSATGKTATHIPTTSNCFTCHSTTAWLPSKWNHTQQPVTAQCSTCHNGAYPPADGKTANHIPYQMLTGVAIPNCDTCHKSGYTAWFPGGFHANVTVTNQCATCHLTGAYGLTAKPATPTHATVTGNCEACHKTTSSWFAAKPDHSLFTAATNCTTCHNGASATGKTATHIPTTGNCITCHSTTAWLPSKWNHTQQPVTAQCSTCHNGAYPPADGKTVNHIPYQSLSGVAIANCDSCHKSGYTTWFPGGFHANVTVSNQCATCHLSAAYGLTAKPADVMHQSVTGTCESCHRSTSNWQTWTMNHSAVTTATCKSCHSGLYTGIGTQGAWVKPANHIPEAQLLNGAAMDCKACHTSTVSWTAMTMNHNGSTGSGGGWCKACHQQGTAYLGNMTTFDLNHRGGSTIKVDCSQSGCHRPLGAFGATYIKWN